MTMPERLVDRTLRAFSDDLSSDTPVPGGGSAAAYAAALGAGLAAMVARIAVKKAPDDTGLRDYIAEVDNLRADFLRLVDDDSAAYARVADAMKLPKATDEEKKARSERLQTALLGASRVPLEVAKTSRRLLDACDRGLEKAPSAAISDLGVGALMAEAALQGRCDERDDQPRVPQGSRTGEGSVGGSRPRARGSRRAAKEDHGLRRVAHRALMRLLHGRPLAESVNAKTRARVALLERRKILPRLDVISVGIDPAASTYQERLGRSGKHLGIDVRAIALAPGAVEEEVASRLRTSSADRSVHGILMLTPLPAPLDEARLVEAIAPQKDVEGVHPRNAGLLAAGRPHFIPSTAEGIVELLKFYEVPLRGEHAVVVGRSPWSAVRPHHFSSGDATVAIAHSKSSDLPTLTRAASVVVVAVGKPGFLTGEMLAPGATVIDAGINVTPSGITGDVDVESVTAVAGALSPVPGGLGAVTTSLLLRNVVTAAEEQNERRVGPPRAANP